MVRLYLVVLFAWLAMFNAVAQETLTLTWEIQHPITKQWIVLGERGSVQEALINHSLLPDPFYGENEKQFQWIEDHQWTAKARFFLSEALYNAQSVNVDFPCIDTYASIFLNNDKILESANYFRPYSVDVRDKLVLGYNEITAVFTPPVLYHKSTYEQQSFHYPAPNDNAKIKAAPLTRKPQYQFGWDWAPRLNTMGFPSPVSISVAKPHIIVTCVVNTLSIGDEAKMELVIEKKGGQQLRSSAFGWTVTLDSSAVQRIPFSVKAPKLWWPNGYGTPYLYVDTLIVEDVDGSVVERKPISFGIRTVELVQQQDEWGTSFAFKINGKPIFMKGGDMIPPSMFGGETTKGEWESWVQLMVESNFNMVRIWGGGDYATDYFLYECDRLGLMVWHDAMFACAMYPGDPAFLANVKDEFEFQLPRIAKHPSVVYVNGNNEVDVAWKNWGFQVQYMLSQKAQATIEKAYDDLFKTLLPNTLSRYSNLPYVHTSPLSNWGKAEYYNHGTQHYWGVWHGTDPMSDFASKIGRFNAEFGFQSFPGFSTLSTFSQEREWDLTNPVMKHHQKSYVGNGMILKHAKALYGKPKNFREFVYFSQLTQAYAVSSAIGGHLLDAPRCMGSLYWQINDCWPGPTWSSVDYHGQLKALHYEVKDLFEGLTAVKQKINDTERIYLLTNNIEVKDAEITTTVFSIEKKGVKLLSTDNQRVSLVNFNHKVLYEQDVDDAPRLIKIDLPNQGQRVFLVGQLKKNRTVSYKLEITNIDSLRKKAVLVIENEDFMADVWLFSTISGVHFSSNFCHLLPGKHEIPFSFESNVGIIKLMYR